jgi:hypothetical protein
MEISNWASDDTASHYDRRARRRQAPKRRSELISGLIQVFMPGLERQCPSCFREAVADESNYHICVVTDSTPQRVMVQ